MPVNPNDPFIITFIKFWLPVLLCMAIIFYASSLPAKDIPSLFSLQNVFYHLVAYAIMTYFFSRALKNTCLKISQPKIIYFTVIFGIVYGILDELHQLYVATRCSSGFDLFMDSLGSLAGSVIYGNVRWRMQNR